MELTDWQEAGIGGVMADCAVKGKSVSPQQTFASWITGSTGKAKGLDVARPAVAASL